VASVRIRCLNPLRELQARGYPVERFDPRRRDRYAAVIFSKRYDDVAYAEARRLRARGAHVVLDLCDNHFHNPDNLAVLRAAAAQLRRMADEADVLVASTEAMADALRAEVGPGRQVTVIGDAVETTVEGVSGPPWSRWWARRRLRDLGSRLEWDAARTPLVWFGSHGGPSGDHGMGDLESVRPVIESLGGEHPVSLTVISNSAEKYDRLIRPWSVPTHYLQWNADTFLAALRLHRIAVLPIRESPFTRCKTNNRLVTALAAGVAVVATGIPSYRPFADCCALDDWLGGLRRYILDAEKRRRDVTAGQRLVERDWVVPVIADQWQRLFDGLRQTA